MSGGGRGGASGDLEEAFDDPDARWKPTTGTVVIERGTRRRRRPVRPGRRERRELEPASPWSRESIESPLPTIEQVRERWRRELGLDASAHDPPTEPVARPASSPASTDLPDLPRSNVSGDVVLGGLVVSIVVAAALVAAWLLVPPEPLVEVDAVTLPTSAVERWAVDLGDVDAIAFGSDGAVAVSNGEIRALDAADGTTRWSASLDGGDPVAVEIYGDIVVTVEETTATVVALRGFALDDGAPVWSRSAAFSDVVLDPGVPLEYSSPDGTTRLRMLDPSTGTPIGPVAEATSVETADGHVIGLRDGKWSVLDLDAAAWVEPSVSGFGLRSVAPVGDHLVGFTDDSDIILFSDDGYTLDQRPFVSGAFGDFAGRAELVGGVPGTSIGIVASGSSIGFDTSMGSIDVIWEVPGRVGPAVDTHVGPVAVARVVDGTTGEVDHALVDVTDGSMLATTDVGVTRETPPTVLADGYVVAPAVGDLDRTIRAFDFDGSERWALSLGAGVDYHVVDGAVYTVDADGNLAAHR